MKVVSERLGHANPAFTMSVYQHVIPGMQEEAATLFSELIFGREEVLVPSTCAVALGKALDEVDAKLGRTVA